MPLKIGTGRADGKLVLRFSSGNGGELLIACESRTGQGVLVTGRGPQEAWISSGTVRTPYLITVPPIRPVLDDKFDHRCSCTIKPPARALFQIGFNGDRRDASQVHISGFKTHRLQQLKRIVPAWKRGQFNSGTIRCQPPHNPPTANTYEGIRTPSHPVERLLVQNPRAAPARAGPIPRRIR